MTLIITILVAVSILSEPRTQPSDFFQHHGYLFLIFISIMPRLTLLFSSVVTGGMIWWLGFFFCPRVLVACLATVTYYSSNPFLVYISWVIAVSGELLEKKSVGNNRFMFRYHRAGNVNQNPFGSSPFQTEPENQSIKADDAIEAEFTRKE